MKAKKRNYTLHWTEATPYKCWVVYVSGPDVAGAMKELDRNFKLDDEDVASGCPKMSEYLIPEIEDPTPPGRDAGRFFWHTKMNNIVIYFPSMNPKLSTLGHELYHAVRRISRKKRLENDNDEPEAYLFEHLFEYFAGKIEEDCRAMNGAEQDKGGRK